VTFVSDGISVDEVPRQPAAALIVSPKIADTLPGWTAGCSLRKTPSSRLLRAIALFYNSVYVASGVSQDLAWAVVERCLDCSIHPRVAIGLNSVVGNRVTLHPGVTVGDNVVIGDETEILPMLRSTAKPISARDVEFTAVQSLVRMGLALCLMRKAINSSCCRSDASLSKTTSKSERTAASIARALGETRIRRGVKFDNLIQVGHNCEIGEDTVVAALTGSRVERLSDEVASLQVRSVQISTSPSVMVLSSPPARGLPRASPLAS
jgi:UDP-3-O-[3-hydroxymyristoyl] glucosamine N-acyltransferase